MAVLHLLSNPDASASCIAALADGDALLLVGDGVFALPTLEVPAAKTGVLRNDAQARGLEPAPDIQVLSYADFVAWVVDCDKSVTWT